MNSSEPRSENELDMNIEAYSQGRYITVTNNTWHNSPAKLANLDYLIEVIKKLA